MNIYLIPYTWVRHFVVALLVGGSALVAWWLALVWVTGASNPTWTAWSVQYPEIEGAVLFGLTTFAIGFTAVLAEGALRRVELVWRMLFAGIAGMTSMLWTLAWYGLFCAVNEDVSSLTLGLQIIVWLGAGLGCGIGPFFVRHGHSLFDRLQKKFELEFIPQPQRSEVGCFEDLIGHIVGGFVAGLWAGGVWQVVSTYDVLGQHDLFLATAAAMFTMGFLTGGLTWGIPNGLYTGWVRVLSPYRYGLRIPIDARTQAVSERFIGHYPRGLDLHLRAEDGVAELHASILLENHRYAVRGLSNRPTWVKRFLERIDLSYEARHPAPLETQLQMEDQIFLGDEQGNQVVLEFLMLPREER